MGDKIKLRSKTFVQAMPKEFDFVIPDAVYLDTCERDPATLIRCLELCNGDMQMFCQQFATRQGVTHESVAVRTMRVLNRPENGEYKKQFGELIQAHKEAKYLLAQHKAFEFISDFKPPKNSKDTPLSQVTSYMKFWLAASMASEVARSKAPPASGDPLSAILDDLENE